MRACLDKNIYLRPTILQIRIVKLSKHTNYVKKKYQNLFLPQHIKLLYERCEKIKDANSTKCDDFKSEMRQQTAKIDEPLNYYSSKNPKLEKKLKSVTCSQFLTTNKPWLILHEIVCSYECSTSTVLTIVMKYSTPLSHIILYLNLLIADCRL